MKKIDKKIWITNYVNFYESDNSLNNFIIEFMKYYKEYPDTKDIDYFKHCCYLWRLLH